jgi:hypothetical protein
MFRGSGEKRLMKAHLEMLQYSKLTDERQPYHEI